MRRWGVRVAIVAGVVLLVAILRVTAFRARPVPVQVVAAERGQVEETITNSRAGSVKARRRAKLSPEFGGQVAELPRREGARVERGSVLLRLEDSAQRARVALAQGEVDSARAERQRACLEAERAGREHERVRRLAEDEIVSTDLLDDMESASQAAGAGCDAATANVTRAMASLQVARTELEKTVVRAPFDGIVADVTIEVGEWTTPSPPALPVPPVLDVLDPASIFVSAPMDEVDSARIETGQTVRVTVDSHRDRPVSGVVSRVAPYVLDLEEQNRTVEIEVELDDPDFATRLLPGTSADVEVILEVRDDVLRVPTATVIDGNSVLKVDGETLSRTEIEIGLRNWDFVEVLSGLEEGDAVVRSLDRSEVREGAEVEIVDELPE